MNILFIGDIVGRPGRSAIKKILPDLKKDLRIDLTIANGENLAAGSGITYDTYQEMIKAGIDYFTSGNHIWSKKNFIKYLNEDDIKVLRPANYPEGAPGKGIAEIKVGSNKVIIINILGRVFMGKLIDDPFAVVDKLLNTYSNLKTLTVLVDFHAEATSEKNCMGYYLDGRVTSMIGTHTHIPTADARILPKGTSYMTDVGMVGVQDSAIGVDLKPVTESFLTGLPFKNEISSGPVIFSAALIKIDPKLGRAESIELIQRIVE